MASTKSTNSMFPAYILNKTIDVNNKGYQIPILWSPTSVSESVNASFDQQNIPGRSSPVISYSYTGARQVSISFIVTTDYLPPGFNSVADYCNCIKALEYPKYEGQIVTSPNSSLHLPNIDIDGVCSSVSIEYKTDRYTRDRGQAAEISLTFLEVVESIKGSINIITGGNASIGGGSSDSSYDDFVESITPKLTLTGEGLTQSSPKTMLSPSGYSYVQTDYEKTDDVTSIICYLLDSNGNYIRHANFPYIYGTDILGTYKSNNRNASGSSKFGADVYQYFYTYYLDKTVSFSVKYVPKNSSGQEFSEYIRYRYFKIKPTTQKK